MPLKTLLIDNYDSYTYNLFQLISEVNGGNSFLQRPTQAELSAAMTTDCSAPACLFQPTQTLSQMISSPGPRY